MKTILKLEEVVLTAVALYALSYYDLGLSAWLWAALFFLPDISMLGYMVNAKFGAISYNIFHHKGIALLIIAIGYFFTIEPLIATGILLFAHASFDRIWGYGLKYVSGFKDTHLGSLEKQKRTPIFR